MPDPQSLPALVRAKYPGVYDDLSDQELDAKVRAKFPGVYDDLPKPAQTAAAPSLKVPGSGLGTMQTALSAVGQNLKQNFVTIPSDLATGIAKGAAHTAIDLGALVHKIPGVSEAVDKLYGTTGLSSQAFDAARQQTAYSNPTQRAGGALETVGELAVSPASDVAKAGVAAIPTTGKAGKLFDVVEAEAGNVPVDTRAIEAAIMRVKQEVNLGAGSMPQVVTKLINRLDEPIQNAGPLVYSESKKLASNMSELTVKDVQGLNKMGRAAVAELAAALGKANADAALVVGKGAEYAKAMNMYHRAMQLRTAVKAAIPIAAGAIGAKYLYDKGKALLGE